MRKTPAYKINWKIAELCGWTSKKVPSDEQVAAQGYDEFRHTWWYNPFGAQQAPPDYYGDLNACNEMESGLDEAQAIKYHELLATISFLEKDKKTAKKLDQIQPAENFLYHASAIIRCEAFLAVFGVNIDEL